MEGSRIFLHIFAKGIKHKHMKRIILTIILITVAITSYARPRAAGFRIGVSGFEADYQHSINKNQFIEADFGVDLGYNINGKPGVKATATYNFIWARPAWTNKGTWALYAGPGLTMGYVNDQAHFTKADGKNIAHFDNNGFMLGICGQVGLEYTFWFPLQLSVDLRPVVGMHINSRHKDLDPVTNAIMSEFAPHVGLYDNGFLGFAPSISVRYRF